MDKQKEGDKKSNVKYQKLKDDSIPSTSSSSTSSRSNYMWFEKYFHRNTGPKYERLKEEEEKEGKQPNKKN